jgi:hypothetical protein
MTTDDMQTSAGILRLVVTKWSLYVCGRRRMAADGVWRAAKPLFGGSIPPVASNTPHAFYRITACFLAGRCYFNEAS